MAERNGRKPNEVTVFEISDILGNDAHVALNWEMLAYQLKIQTVTIQQNIKPHFSAEGNSIMGFVKLLTIWIGKSGRSVTTVGSLCTLLQKREFVDAAEKISAEFSKELRIVTDSGNEVDQMEEELDGLHISHPHGVKILDLSSQEEKLVIYTERIVELLELAKDKHIAIISINGRQRSGKSFMLNQFRKYLQFGYNKPGADWISRKLEYAFEWGGRKERITSGIEILSQPTFVNAKGEEIAIYLMDTQGLFDNKTEITDNILIFAFSLLLSSVTIFNDKVYSEDVIQFLQLFLEYAKLAAAEDQNNDQNFQFQRLIFLLRDWPHEDEFKWGHYDDTECPPGQDLNLKEDFLGIENANSEMSADALKARQNILSSFQTISCFASSHPNRSNKILDADDPSQWDEDFRNCIQEFVKRTLSQDSLTQAVKTIGNEKQTGGSLSAYVKVWADIIQSPEGLPTVPNLLEATINLHYQNVTANLIAIYQSDLEALILENQNGVPVTDLIAKHQEAIEKCLRLLKERSSVGGDDVKKQYQVNLQSALEKEGERFQQINESNLKKVIRLEVDEARNEAIQQAEINYNEALGSLERARGKLELVHAKRESYTREETHTVTKRNRLVGIRLHPVSFDSQRVVFDQGKYDAAVNEALGEVNLWEEKVRVAEANLNALRKRKLESQSSLN